MVVDWEKINEKPIPKIEEKESGVGPLLPDEMSVTREQNQPNKKPAEITSLVAGPGVYRSIGLISVLKKLKEYEKDPNILVGHGLSSVILAYYSLGYKTDYIEWKFFKFFKEIGEEKVFSESWLKSVEETLLSEFKESNIEDGKITLLIPVYNNMKKEVEFLKRGPLVRALLANLDPLNNLDGKYGPGYTQSFIPAKELYSLGVNTIMAFDFLGKSLQWKMGNGFLNGTFQKVAILQQKEANFDKNIKYIKFPLDEFYLDDPTKLPDIVHESKRFVRKLPEKLGEKESI